MSKYFFDYDDGDFIMSVSDNIAMDSEGNLMVCMCDNMMMDYNGPSCQDICSRIYREFLRLFWALRYAASCFACVRNMP